MCDYFALCDNEPTDFYNHPIMGDVAICYRCTEVAGITYEELGEDP